MRSATDRATPPLYRVTLVAPDGCHYEDGFNYKFTTENQAEARAEFNAPIMQKDLGGKAYWPGPVAKVCGLTWNYKEARWEAKKWRDAWPHEFDAAPAQPVATGTATALPF